MQWSMFVHFFCMDNSFLRYILCGTCRILLGGEGDGRLSAGRVESFAAAGGEGDGRLHAGRVESFAAARGEGDGRLSAKGQESSAGELGWV